MLASFQDVGAAVAAGTTTDISSHRDRESSSSAIDRTQPNNSSETINRPPNTFSLPHDLIKCSLEYLQRDQQLKARVVNWGWSRAVADVIESRFEEEGTSTMKDGEWKPEAKIELRSVLCCIQNMTDTFKSSIRKIRFPQSFTGDCAMDWEGLESMPMLEIMDLRGTAARSMTLSPALASLRVINLAECHQLKLGDGSIQGLELLPALEELDLSGARNLKSVANLSACETLKRLTLTDCHHCPPDGQSGDDGILGLERIPALEQLDLRCTNTTTVSHFSVCKALKKLDLDYCEKLTDSGILGLELIPTLEELSLWGTNITTVSHLVTSKALKKLNLGGCDELIDDGIAGLEQIPTLEELNLTGTRITTVVRLSASKALKKLVLDSCKEVTDEGIAGLDRIPTLEELILVETKVTTVAHLSSCKALKKLDLTGCQELTQEGILGLERIPTLEELILACTNVAVIAHLSACHALKRLDVESCDELSDESILGLEQIPTLEELILRSTNITNVFQLSASNALKKLDLGGCEKLTDAGIRGLHKIPTLKELILPSTNLR
jgi:Leucine-rich repeat (LRR) protein